MHYEISTLRRAASSLVIGVALLLGMGMTADAQHGNSNKVKSEEKMEKSEVKTHQREEREREDRVGLKNHQREERETERESKHKARKQCVKGCKEAHQTAMRACRVKTGADRSACERAANQAHRSCQASCPR